MLTFALGYISGVVVTLAAMFAIEQALKGPIE